MNFKTKHMTPKLFITAIMLCLLPASATFGQELKKEKLKGASSVSSGSDYAVFYSAGLPESAIWPLGMKLSKNGATIRHTAENGNGSNISVNDKVPFRFIIAPTEKTSTSWAEAMGFDTADNHTLNPDGINNAGSGCKNYSTTEFPDGWRLPTQREMMLMWLFREGINTIYAGNQLGQNSYWCATESTKDNACYLGFSDTAPQSDVKSKSSSLLYRCVRDY